jgi:hypothetical protein
LGTHPIQIEYEWSFGQLTIFRKKAFGQMIIFRKSFRSNELSIN